eukprot:gene1500-2893_t
MTVVIVGNPTFPNKALKFSSTETIDEIRKEFQRRYNVKGGGLSTSEAGDEVPDFIVDNSTSYFVDYELRVKEQFKRAMEECYENEDVPPTILISEVSLTTANNLIQRLNFTVVEEKFTPSKSYNNMNIFNPFVWRRHINDNHNSINNNDTAVKHITEELSKFCGLINKPKGFMIVDVHLQTHLLDVNDSKIGNFSGGSDVIIVPMKTSLNFLSREICMLFELRRDSYEQGVAQAIIELICARCLSFQPQVMVVLTDLCTGASVYRTHYDCESKQFSIWEYPLISLTNMAMVVSDFLLTTAIPRADYQPREDLNDPRGEGVKSFKRMKLSTSEVLEQHLEMLQDAENIQERAQITASILRAFDMGESTYVSMILDEESVEHE